MDLAEEKQEIIKCFHCGNETPMQKVGKYTWGSRDMEFSEIDFLYEYELFVIAHNGITNNANYSMINFHILMNKLFCFRKMAWRANPFLKK